jgi:hypothetical protein
MIVMIIVILMIEVLINGDGGYYGDVHGSDGSNGSGSNRWW